MASPKQRSCFVVMPFGTKRIDAAASTGGKKRSSTKKGKGAQRSGRTAAGQDASPLWRLIVPEGEDREQYEIDFDRLYEEVIKPAVTSVPGYEIDCRRCDEIPYTGWIHEKMIEAIAGDDIAVVELTTLNPNVFYELGVRHALNRGVTVLIQQKGLGESIPFNLGGMSVVQYDPDDPAAAMDEIRQTISSSLARRGHVDSLVFRTLDDLEVAVNRPKPLHETETFRYRLAAAPDRTIGVMTGDIANVHGVDVWVSSENTEMMMARYHERAISATIRYMGAGKSSANAILEDTIADELLVALGKASSVPAGTVVVTGSGELANTNGVKWIFHAASVVGQIGSGYSSIANPSACVVNALKMTDTAAFKERHAEKYGELPVRSMIFPLIGTGQAGGDPEDAFAGLVQVAMEYLKRTPDTTIECVYFLAFTDADRDVCKRVLEFFPSLEPVEDEEPGGGTETGAPAAPMS